MMDASGPSGSTNPLISLSSCIHQHFDRFGAGLVSRLDEGRRLAGNLLSNWPLPEAAAQRRIRPSPFPFVAHARPAFASLGQAARHAFDIALSSEHVSNTLAGTSVYTVSNSNNEFVLISDPTGAKSLGLLCFRKEDAEVFLAQVLARRKELKIGAKVVPISLDQVYSLKVEGIAFRFLPDPAQIRNAVELRGSERKTGFDGVPVFQSDLLVVKRKSKRFLPIFFRKEDLQRALASSRASRSALPPQIMVGSLEDVLKKMEMNEKNSGWDDLIFIPPGRGYTEHIQEVAKA